MRLMKVRSKLVIGGGVDIGQYSQDCTHVIVDKLVYDMVAFSFCVYVEYFNQILTAVLEVLDDSDSSTGELALLLIVEMLKNQKDGMEDSIEIVIEKLLHVTKDVVPKVTFANQVSNEAEHCLTIVLSQYDPFRCLSVIVPLLVSEDEKTLVTCINCLTKLVGWLSQEELMAQLPSFLPAIFRCFWKSKCRRSQGGGPLMKKYKTIY